MWLGDSPSPRPPFHRGRRRRSDGHAGSNTPLLFPDLCHLWTSPTSRLFSNRLAPLALLPSSLSLDLSLSFSSLVLLLKGGFAFCGARTYVREIEACPSAEAFGESRFFERRHRHRRARLPIPGNWGLRQSLTPHRHRHRSIRQKVYREEVRVGSEPRRILLACARCGRFRFVHSHTGIGVTSGGEGEEDEND